MQFRNVSHQNTSNIEMSIPHSEPMRKYNNKIFRILSENNIVYYDKTEGADSARMKFSYAKFGNDYNKAFQIVKTVFDTVFDVNVDADSKVQLTFGRLNKG